MKAYLTVSILLYLVIPQLVAAQSMLDADAKRAAARQRAFDRGFVTKQKVEETKSTYMETIISKDRLESPPASHIYEQVMQAGQFYRSKGMTNANATHTTDSTVYAQSLSEARDLYPDLNEPTSIFSRRCAFLQNWATSSNLPISTDARRPLLLAHIASLEIFGSKKHDSQDIAPAAPPVMTPSELRAQTARANARFLPGPPLRSVGYLEIRGTTAIGPDGSTYTVRKHITGNGFYIENGTERLHIPAEGTRTIWPNGMDATFRRMGENRIEFIQP